MIENGACAQQRVVSATLATLPERAPAHELSGPALVVIGEVVALHATLAWFGRAAAAAPAAGPELD